MQLGVLLGSGAFSGLAGSLGMMVFGSAINMLTASKRRAKGAKENDLKVSSSAYGKGIAIAMGTCRLTGNMIWATDITEKRKYIGQKGKEKSEKKFEKGKAQEILEYYGNFCMAFCEGEIAEVLRIWADSNVIYDKLNPDEAEDPGFSQEEGQAGGKMGIDANKKGTSPAGGRWPYRFYGGTETQLVDPMLRRYEGDKATAHRGLCYIAFDNFPLMDFGNRIPTITVEVVPKRNPTVGYKAISTLEDQDVEHPVTRPANPQGRAFFDFYRGRMFDVSDGVTMVYDLEAGKEIARWAVPENVLEVIGCDHFGRVLGSVATGLTGVIRAHDPLTGVVVDELGLGSFALFSAGRYRDREVLAFPSSDLCAPLFGQPSTAILSQFGDVSVFTTTMPLFPAISPTEWSAMSSNLWHTLFARGVAGISSGAPGIREFFVSTRAGLVYRFIVGESVPTLGDTGGEIEHWPDLPNPDAVLFHSALRTGFGRGFCEPPFWCVGADCYVIIEHSLSNTGSGQRLYINRLDANGRHLSRTYISNYSYGFGQGGISTNRIGQGMITGSEIVFVQDNDEVIRFNCRDGSFRRQALNKSFPRIRGEQWYLDRIDSILTRLTLPIGERWALLRTDVYEQVPVTLAEIITMICVRAGISASRVDTSQITDVEVPGYYIESPGPGGDHMANLMEAYLFDLCESDDVLKFVSRGNRPIVRIPQRLLGMNEQSEDGAIKETVVPDIELPQTVVVTYVDKDNDYQSGSQRYRRPKSPYGSMQSTDQIDIGLSICLSPDDAKQMAQKIVFSIWAENAHCTFMLPPQFLIYDPTDVVDVQLDNGLTLELRLTQADIGANWQLDCTGVRQVSPRWMRPESTASEFFNVDAYDPNTGWLLQPNNGSIQDPETDEWLDASTGAVVPAWVDPRLAYPVYAIEDLNNVYNSTAVGAPAGGPIHIPRSTVPAVDPVLLDIPFNEDDDAGSDTGFTAYWGVMTNRRFSTAAVLGVKLEPGDYEVLGSVQSDLVYGYMLDVLPDPPHGDFATDDVSVVRMMPAYDYDAAEYYQWESIPDAEWPSFANMALIGNEIVLFKTVEVDPDTGIVTLSHFIRGHRGTEWAAHDHAGSEMLFMMNTSAEQVIQMPSLALGQPVTYKAASGAMLQGMKLPLTQVYEGRAQKPYAVNHIVATPEEGLADTTFVWQRRTRYNGPLRDGVGTVALNEEAEAYRLFVLKEPVTTDTATWFNPTTMTRPEGLALTHDPITGQEYFAVRMVELTEAEWTYTDADRIADGIGDDAYAIVIYQMSARVGYGFPAFLNMQTGD